MQGFPVTFTFPLHWSELDAYNHVNNARHFVWFESARATYFRKIGLMRDEPGGVGPILKTNYAEYLEPVRYPSELVVGARVSKIGTTSFTMEYACARTSSPERLVSKGSSVMVVFDYALQQKVSMPAEVRAAIEALEGHTL